MKLNKRTLLVLAAGAFIIAAGYLALGRFPRIDEEKNELNEELALVQTSLAGVKLDELDSKRVQLEGRLSGATSNFSAVEAILSQPIGSVAVTDILFDIAQTHGVEVTGMTSSPLASEGLEGVNCSVVSLTATVEGDVPNLVSFATELNNYFTTGVTKSITITIPEMTSEERVSADIQLVVYTYRGD